MGWIRKPKLERYTVDPPTNPTCDRSPNSQHWHSVTSSRRGYKNCWFCGETKWVGR